LPSGTVARCRECPPRFYLVATLDRQETLSAQTMEFRHIKAAPWFFHSGYRAVDMSKGIR
jgi:hypothetical protein